MMGFANWIIFHLLKCDKNLNQFFSQMVLGFEDISKNTSERGVNSKFWDLFICVLKDYLTLNQVKFSPSIFLK